MKEHLDAAQDARSGERPAPAARRDPRQAEVLRLQQAAGNRATQQVLGRSIFDPIKNLFGVKHVETVEGEQVEVSSASQVTEAALIIGRVQYRYGVDISSMKGVKATKDHYQSAAASELAKIKAIPWTMRELRAVDRALAHFAPILGLKRGGSTRKDAAQEVTSVGKVNNSITGGTLDTTTLGEFYKASQNFSLYRAGENSTVDFPGDVDKQLEGTTVHEISHGLMFYAIDRFMAASGYWLDQDTKSGDAAAEDPPTKYGKKNAREDLCESMMLLFVDNARLKTKAPKRHALLTQVVSEWTAPAPVGDFPVPSGDTAMA